MAGVGGRLQPGLPMAGRLRCRGRSGPGPAGRAARRRRRGHRAAVRRVQPRLDRHPAGRGPAADHRLQSPALSPGGQREPAAAHPARRRGRTPAGPGCRRGQGAPRARRVPGRPRRHVPGLRPVRRARRAGDRAHRAEHLPRFAGRSRGSQADGRDRRRLSRRPVRPGSRRPRRLVRRRRPDGAGPGQRSGSTWQACRPSACRSTTPASTCPPWPPGGSSGPTGPAFPAWPRTCAP